MLSWEYFQSIITPVEIHLQECYGRYLWDLEKYRTKELSVQKLCKQIVGRCYMTSLYCRCKHWITADHERPIDLKILPGKNPMSFFKSVPVSLTDPHAAHSIRWHCCLDQFETICTRQSLPVSPCARLSTSLIFHLRPREVWWILPQLRWHM